MLHTIENDFLKVVVNDAGAELTHLIQKSSGIDFMWEANPAFWGKRSPVLFPIVGTLKNDTYKFKNADYKLSRHGFARDRVFEVTHQAEQILILTLVDDASTLLVYPFHFRFSLIYALLEDKLSVTYKVENTGNENMYFSVGGHPAFKLPLKDHLQYEDYYLAFNQIENTGRWPISADGLIENAPIELLHSTQQLPLSKALFYKDAIVLKHLQSNEIMLKTDKDSAGLLFEFHEFPFFGIWAAKDAPFICLEPWCGIADAVSSNQLLIEKEGIHSLDTAETFERTWSVTCF
ncbi:MAG: aldose 1-epimerase family protein [Ferruginibacter sp.]